VQTEHEYFWNKLRSYNAYSLRILVRTVNIKFPGKFIQPDQNTTWHKFSKNVDAK